MTKEEVKIEAKGSTPNTETIAKERQEQLDTVKAIRHELDDAAHAGPGARRPKRVQRLCWALGYEAVCAAKGEAGD